MNHLEIEAPPQSRLDLQAELAAVTAAVTRAATERDRIQRQINAAGSIEQLGHLHNAWEQANEDLAAATARAAELEQMLAQAQ